MINKKAIIFSVAISLLVVLALFVFPALPKHADADTTADDGLVSGWMWSANVGWVKADSNTAKPVKVDPVTRQWSGFAWSPALGWIDFNPATTTSDTYPYTGLDAHGVQTSADGIDVTGWARLCSIFQTYCSGVHKSDASNGGWNGWIKMVNVTRNTTTGGLEGFAWGDLNLGWLKFGVHHSLPPGGCTSDPVDTNCDGTTDCDPCNQVCVVSCGGGGPSVTCLVTPDKGDTNTSFTWYVSSLSGFTGDPSLFTYSWSGSDTTAGPSGSGTWNILSTPNRNEVSVLSYSGVGTKTGSVTVTDGNGNTATDSSCSNGVTDGIVITEPCIDDDLSVIPVPPSIAVCCNADTDTPPDGKCGQVDEADSCKLELGSSDNLVTYTEDGSGMSAANAKIDITTCDTPHLSLHVSGLPAGGGLIPVCSLTQDGEYLEDTCNDLTGKQSFWFGVKYDYRPSGFVNGSNNLSTASLKVSADGKDSSAVSVDVEYYIPGNT